MKYNSLIHHILPGHLKIVHEMLCFFRYTTILFDNTIFCNDRNWKRESNGPEFVRYVICQFSWILEVRNVMFRRTYLMQPNIIVLECLFKGRENCGFMLWVPKVDWKSSKIRKMAQIFLVLFVLASKSLHVNWLPYLHVHVCKILLSNPF